MYAMLYIFLITSVPLSCAKMGSLRRVSSSALGPVSDCKQEKWTWSFVTRQSSQNKVSPTANNCQLYPPKLVPLHGRGSQFENDLHLLLYSPN